MEIKHLAALEGYLRFRESNENLEQTLSIHILYTLKDDNFFAVCLDYNEGCTIPLRDYIEYILHPDDESTLLHIIADSTRELIESVLEYIISGEGEDETGMEAFRTESDLWDEYRYFMRAYMSFAFGKGKGEISEAEDPYMRIDKEKLKIISDHSVPGDEYEILKPKIIECTVAVKKELLDIISEKRRS